MEYPLRLGERKRRQDDPADETEGRDARSDADRSDADDARGERGMVPTTAQREAHVGNEIRPPRDTPDVAALLPISLDPAEPSPSLSGRCRHRQALGFEPGRLVLEMKRQLFIEI
jgi:hypothetical protein